MLAGPLQHRPLNRDRFADAARRGLSQGRINTGESRSTARQHGSSATGDMYRNSRPREEYDPQPLYPEQSKIWLDQGSATLRIQHGTPTARLRTTFTTTHGHDRTTTTGTTGTGTRDGPRDGTTSAPIVTGRTTTVTPTPFRHSTGPGTPGTSYQCRYTAARITRENSTATKKTRGWQGYLQRQTLRL